MIKKINRQRKNKKKLVVELVFMSDLYFMKRIYYSSIKNASIFISVVNFIISFEYSLPLFRLYNLLEIEEQIRYSSIISKID